MAMRALRFARVKLCYRVLYAEGAQSSLETLAQDDPGQQIRRTPYAFHHRLSGRLTVDPDQALHAYYVEAGGRRILLSCRAQAAPGCGTG